MDKNNIRLNRYIPRDLYFKSLNIPIREVKKFVKSYHETSIEVTEVTNNSKTYSYYTAYIREVHNGLVSTDRERIYDKSEDNLYRKLWAYYSKYGEAIKQGKIAKHTKSPSAEKKNPKKPEEKKVREPAQKKIKEKAQDKPVISFVQSPAFVDKDSAIKTYLEDNHGYPIRETVFHGKKVYSTLYMVKSKAVHLLKSEDRDSLCRTLYRLYMRGCAIPTGKKPILGDAKTTPKLDKERIESMFPETEPVKHGRPAIARDLSIRRDFSPKEPAPTLITNAPSNVHIDLTFEKNGQKVSVSGDNMKQLKALLNSVMNFMEDNQ